MNCFLHLFTVLNRRVVIADLIDALEFRGRRSVIPVGFAKTSPRFLNVEFVGVIMAGCNRLQRRRVNHVTTGFTDVEMAGFHLKHILLNLNAAVNVDRVVFSVVSGFLNGFAEMF